MRSASGEYVHDLDQQVRLAAFEFLRRLTGEIGETLPFELLRRGFDSTRPAHLAAERGVGALRLVARISRRSEA